MDKRTEIDLEQMFGGHKKWEEKYKMNDRKSQNLYIPIFI